MSSDGNNVLFPFTENQGLAPIHQKALTSLEPGLLLSYTNDPSLGPVRDQLIGIVDKILLRRGLPRWDPFPRISNAKVVGQLLSGRPNKMIALLSSEVPWSVEHHVYIPETKTRLRKAVCDELGLLSGTRPEHAHRTEHFRRLLEPLPSAAVSADIGVAAGLKQNGTAQIAMLVLVPRHVAAPSVPHGGKPHVIDLERARPSNRYRLTKKSARSVTALIAQFLN